MLKLDFSFEGELVHCAVFKTTQVHNKTLELHQPAEIVSEQER